MTNVSAMWTGLRPCNSPTVSCASSVTGRQCPDRNTPMNGKVDAVKLFNNPMYRAKSARAASLTGPMVGSRRA